MRRAVCLLAALGILGCAGEDGGREREPGGALKSASLPGPAHPGPGPAHPGPAGSGAGAPATGSDTPDRIPFPPADSAPELRTYRLLIVNPRPIEAIILADAGAGGVVLDTVERLDSARVNVRVRAVALRLLATDRWGEPLASESIELRPDTLVRWEVPPSPTDAAEREPAGRS